MQQIAYDQAMVAQQISPAAFARKHGVSRQRVMAWLNEGRIPGAQSATDLMGRRIWMIPAAAPRPAPLKPNEKGNS